MKVIIAGGRDFDSFYDADEFFSRCFFDREITEVISGGARGADKIGEDIASSYYIDTKIFPAKWDEHGKAAGYIRNKEMAEYANALLAFWDGKSKGTKHMIDLALKHKLETHIYFY